MIWQDVKGEMLTYDGTKECESMLLDRDLFTWKGHLCEGYSLQGYEDYGPINVGDRVLILHDLDEVVIIRGERNERPQTLSFLWVRDEYGDQGL